MVIEGWFNGFLEENNREERRGEVRSGEVRRRITVASQPREEQLKRRPDMELQTDLGSARRGVVPRGHG